MTSHKATRLQKYIDLVNKIIAKGEVSDEDKDDINKSYEQLYKKYLNFDSEDLKDLTADQYRVFKFLELGRDAHQEFIDKIFSGVLRTDSYELANIVLQENIKKSELFYSIHKDVKISNLSQSEQKEIATLFGGLLGIEVSVEAVASLKMEMLGQAKAYIASGNNIRDLKRFRELSEEQRGGQDEASYLIKQMENTLQSVHYRRDPTNKHLTGILTSHVHGGEKHSVEGSFVSDCAYVNDETKEIHICMATLASRLINTNQLTSTYLVVKALENTIAQGKHYDGYTVHVHLMNGGFIPTRSVFEDKNHVGYAFIQGLTKNTNHTEELKQEIIDALNQTSIMFYLNEDDPSLEKTKMLYRANLATLGADTLDFFNKKKEITNTLPNIDEQMGAMGLYCLNQIKKTTALLVREDINISFGERGKIHLTDFLNATVGAFENHLLNFNVCPQSREFSQTVEMLQSISKDFLTISEKINENGVEIEGSGLLNKLVTLGILFSIEDNIARVAKGVKSNQHVFTYNQEQFDALCKKTMSYDDKKQKLVDELAPKMYKALKKGQLGWVEYLKETSKEKGDKVPPFMDRILLTFNKYVSCMQHGEEMPNYYENFTYADEASMTGAIRSSLNTWNNSHGIWRDVVYSLTPLLNYHRGGRSTLSETLGMLKSDNWVNTETMKRVIELCEALVDEFGTQKNHMMYQSIRGASKAPTQKRKKNTGPK